MKLSKIIILIAIIALAIMAQNVAADDFASSVFSYSMLDPNAPYNDPSAVLGKPATMIQDPGYWPIPPGSVFHCSLVYSAWNVSPEGDGLVATVQTGGHIAVEFDEPIYDDPENWHGMDFLVFGNARFDGIGYVYEDTNMENYTLKDGLQGYWEPSDVSVSQDGVTWYTYSSGPYADDYAPTNSYAWDFITRDWAKDSDGNSVELDFAKPVDPSLSKSSFANKSAAKAIDMYKDSAGGTAFDLEDISALPVLNNPGHPMHGRKWIKYIKVDGADNEVDAFGRIGHAKPTSTVAEAVKMADGERVIISDAVVTTDTYETGTYCYIQSLDGSCGVRINGRVLEKGDEVTVYGVMDTFNCEKTIIATSVEVEDTPVDFSPVGITNRAVGGYDFNFNPTDGSGQMGVTDAYGLNNTGLLVRTWGEVVSSDPTTKDFVIDDGSGVMLKCSAPRETSFFDPDRGIIPSYMFTPPAVGEYAVVTGISSLYEDTSGDMQPVVKLRTESDLQIMP